MAKIQLNGKKVTITSNYSILDLLKKYKLANKKVAIEHNGIIVPKTSYKKKYLKNNDSSSFFKKFGGLIKIGITQNNVNDIGVILRHN